MLLNLNLCFYTNSIIQNKICTKANRVPKLLHSTVYISGKGETDNVRASFW